MSINSSVTSLIAYTNSLLLMLDFIQWVHYFHEEAFNVVWFTTSNKQCQMTHRDFFSFLKFLFDYLYFCQKDQSTKTKNCHLSKHLNLQRLNYHNSSPYFKKTQNNSWANQFFFSFFTFT